MKTTILKHRFTVAACAALLMASSMLRAAPSLKITKPPVTPVASGTGPIIDPQALMGQWFRDIGTGVETNRLYEFYDNRTNMAGGTAGTLAINGYVSSVDFVAGPGTGIKGFQIFATIINDAPALVPPWNNGTNSHGEFLATVQQVAGELINPKLVIEFALSRSVTNVPLNWQYPYSNITPYIVATNNDEEAWYCWNPGYAYPPGGYFVPTWDFTNIPLGALASRLLCFTVPGILPPGDSRYAAITNSWTNRFDVLLNRTTSLKISDWLDTIKDDNGGGYPALPRRSSNASVFHNYVPEPVLAGLVILCAAAALRRRTR